MQPEADASMASDGRLALIGGHAIAGSEAVLAAGAEPLRIETKHGPVDLLERGELLLLQRHGEERYRTAAAIDHRANLIALANAGCARVVAICSVGALRAELGVGTWLCPDDFVALQLGISLSEGREGEIVPLLDSQWRRQLVETWRRVCEPELRDGGVYWQAKGPRFETPAEIRLMSAHADVVGMTMASECILAGELGIEYAALCIVDNLANGVGERPLSVAEFEQGKQANRAALLAAVPSLLSELGA